jgi:hypothetical protein
MLIFSRLVSCCMILSCAAMMASAQQQPSGSQGPATQALGAPAFEEWGDDFEGKALDQSKWERFTFEGASGGKIEVKEGQLRQRGMGGSRFGVRSKPDFTGDRFIVEAVVAKVGAALPEEGQKSLPLGFATISIMFDSTGRNRIEWILTSEGTFEAWSVIDGRGERLDNRKLGTKIEHPTLGIVRRGDEFFFMLNGQPGLQKSIKNLPRSFHVMLYGFGSSENNWDSVRVVTPKQS